MSNDKIFISYSRSDSNFAVQLTQDLKNNGADIWFDQFDIKAGNRWDASIEKALNAAPIMLAILTPSSIASENVMDEVSYAIENGKSVIPILLIDCAIPFRLKRLQHIDFTKDYEKGLHQLLEALTLQKRDNQNPETQYGEYNQQNPLKVTTRSAENKIQQDTPIGKNPSKKYLLIGGTVILVVLLIVLANSIFFRKQAYDNKTPELQTQNPAGSTIDSLNKPNNTTEKETNPTTTVPDKDKVPDNKNIEKANRYKEVINLRLNDINQAADNLLTLVKQIKTGNVGLANPLNSFNDLNNNLWDLWLKVAGYGIGADPYLDNIMASASGFNKGKAAPDYGIETVSIKIGIPRLFDEYQNLLVVQQNIKDGKSNKLRDGLKSYNNPSIYPFKDFYERAYSQYRLGKNINSADCAKDLADIDRWLNVLKMSIGDAKKIMFE